MTVDLDELEAKARAATQPKDIDRVLRSAAAHGLAVMDPIRLADAAFIAAANPAVALELIARLRVLEGIVRDRTSCFEHVGNCCAEWCQHCKEGVVWERRAIEAQR